MIIAIFNSPIPMHTFANAGKGMIKVKLYKSLKEKEVFYYFNAKEEKLWLFRHKYYDGPTGKRKEKKKSGFKTEKAAIKALLEVKASTLRGETKSIENDNLTIAQWLDTWYEMNRNKWKVTTRKQREITIRLNIKPLLGHYKLQKLDRATYQNEYINALEREYKPSSVRLLHNIFKIAINAAVEEELLPRNRFTKVSFSNSDEKEAGTSENFLTPVELNKLLRTAKETEHTTNYSYLLTIAYTGIRRGEACGLQWQNINFDNNTITIERTRDSKGARSPKTKNSYRTILVDEVVMAQLKKYQTWCKQIMLAFGVRYTENSFVFISYQTGEPISDTGILYMFRRVQEAAGLVYEDENGEMKSKSTLHGLRHTHATILLNSGQNVKVIAERLGNTPAMIYEIYGHVLKELEQQSVEVFSNMLKTSGAISGAN